MIVTFSWKQFQYCMLLTAIYVAYQYKWNSLLHFHGNGDYANVPQLYSVLTLLICDFI
jgi:hypothetical protein